MDSEVRPAEEKLYANARAASPTGASGGMILELRQRPRTGGVATHMPRSGRGRLGITAMAFVAAESARTNFGPFVLNAQAPTRATSTRCCTTHPDQQERYLRPLLEGRVGRASP